MTNEGKVIGITQSVCPVCLKTVGASRVKYGGEVYLEKSCLEHGSFKTLVWQGPPDYEQWGAKQAQPQMVNHDRSGGLGCPHDCGICSRHEQNTCCVLLEVTSRCNLNCPVCFADAGEGTDPPIDTVKKWYRRIKSEAGTVNIQLSGGEPTLREDLGDIIRAGKEMGFSFFQLNTNGLRLLEKGYAKSLYDAGLNCVFLQFDGLCDDTYIELRGARLLKKKLGAIAACAEAGLGVVLVPTLKKGVNVHEIGDILRFGLSKMPAVRGVHFQPASYFGRHDGFCSRLTLPEVLREIQVRSDGAFLVSDFSPNSSEHPYCSFNADYTVRDGKPILRKSKGGPCCEGNAARRAGTVVASRWTGVKIKKQGCCDDLDKFLYERESRSFTVSGMCFMDAWNIDLERLRRCHLHEIAHDGSRIPFCAFNLTDTEGRALYRKKYEY